MTPETLTALRASIAHHRKNLEAEKPEDVELGPEHCALCAKFYESSPYVNRCTGCPVAERAKAHGCIDTPYDDVVDALTCWEAIPDDRQYRETYIAAERAEIAFLESLLPEGEKA